MAGHRNNLSLTLAHIDVRHASRIAHRRSARRATRLSTERAQRRVQLKAVLQTWRSEKPFPALLWTAMQGAAPAMLQLRNEWQRERQLCGSCGRSLYLQHGLSCAAVIIWGLSSATVSATLPSLFVTVRIINFLRNSSLQPLKAKNVGIFK